MAAFRPKVLRVYRESLGPLPRSGGCLITDPQLGVDGLPQSATGQTALLTGVNAASRLGQHLQGFPNRLLRQLIRQYSLFGNLKRKGLKVTFANTYTPEFFDRRPRWLSATTVMCEAAQVDLRRMDHLLADRSLFMDFTNRILRDRGYRVPLRTPAEAAGILLQLSESYDLCLYEYFLTDLVGHRGSLGQAVILLQELDAFLFELVRQADLKGTSIVVSSDHGNIERMDTKRHTGNPVPTLLWGTIQRCFPCSTETFDLTQIAPLIEKFLSQEGQAVP